ncbi:hypothetical protein JCM3770_003120 [Rhodotorula araucariae]
MDTDNPAPSPSSALEALAARLAPFVPPASTAPSPLAAALAGLHAWLVQLAALVRALRSTPARLPRGKSGHAHPPPPLTRLPPPPHRTQDGRPPPEGSTLPALFREQVLAYAVPPPTKAGEGERAGADAALDAVAALLRYVLEYVLADDEEDDADAWGALLVAVLLGVERHLADNDYDDGRSDREIQEYRKLFAEHLFAPLVRVGFPTTAGLPAASGQEIDHGRRTAVPSEAKYAALAVLATAMSRHKENKRLLREMLPADHLGAIFQSGADAHLSQLALEIAFRIAPPAPKRKSQASTAASPSPGSAREQWIKTLFSRKRFGTNADEWRTTFDALDVNEWEEGTRQLLIKLAMGHIKRSQHFTALSLDYNGHALLDCPAESQHLSPSVPTKPTLAQVLSGFYEPTSVWLCQHILATSVREPAEMLEQRKRDREALGLRSQVVDDPDGDREVEKDRAVVDLAGVQRAHVEDLGAEHDLLRVTILLDSSTPLKLNSRTHPAAPAHIGTGLHPASESQLGTRISRCHRLVMLLSAEGSSLAVLRKVLEERRTMYPKLGEELYRFPVRTPTSAGAGTARKAVTFAPTPDTATDQRAMRAAAVPRAPRKSSEAGPVVSEPAAGRAPVTATGTALETQRADDAGEGVSSQDASIRRRHEVAALAELVAAARASTSGSGEGSTATGSSPGRKGRAAAADAGDLHDAGQELGGVVDDDDDDDDGGEGLVSPAKIGAAAAVVKGKGRAHEVPVAGKPAASRAHTTASVPQAMSKSAARGVEEDNKPAARALERTSSDLTDPPTDNDDDIEVLPPRKTVVKKPSRAARPPRRSPRLSDRRSQSPAAVPVPKIKATAKARKIVAAGMAESPRAQVQTGERAPALPSKRVVVPPRQDGDEKENDEPQSASTAGGGGGRARAPRAAASKAAAMLQGTKKRGRSESDREEEDEGTGAGEDQAPATAHRGKVVKHAGAAAPAKRRRTTPGPAPSTAPEPDTDYDDETPSTLDRTRRSDSPAKRYGRERKMPAPNGGRRKAARPTKAEKAVKSPAKKRQGKEREIEKSEREGQEAPADRQTRSRAPREKVVKKVGDVSRDESVFENASPPPAKGHDKRVTDDIPPPRDLTARTLERVKELEAPTKPRSREGKEKPIGSFSQLVRTPSDEVMVAKEPAAHAAQNEDASEKDDLFHPGFHPEDLAHVPNDNAVAPGPSFAHHEANAARVSPSPLLDPAKDETFVDRAVPESAVSPVVQHSVNPVGPQPPSAAAVKPAQQVARPVNRVVGVQAQAQAPIQVDSPAVPRGADDSGVHFGPLLGSEGDELCAKASTGHAGAFLTATATRTAVAPASARGGQTGLARFGAASPFYRPHLSHKPISYSAAPSIGTTHCFDSPQVGPSGVNTRSGVRVAADRPVPAVANKAVQVGVSLGVAAPSPPQRERVGETSRPPPQMFRKGFVPSLLSAAAAGPTAEPLPAHLHSGNGSGYGNGASTATRKGEGLPPHVSVQRASGPSTSTPYRGVSGRPSTSRTQMTPVREEGEVLDDAPWVDEDEELLAFAESFGRALVEKQRARRAAREALHAQGIFRFNEMLGRYLAAAHQETTEIARRVSKRADQLAAPMEGEGYGALAEVWRACGRAWEDAEGALAELRA